MNDNDYLEELQDRLLSYLDMMDILKPERYKDIQRFTLKVDMYKSMIKTTKEEIKRVEAKLKEARDNARRPRIN